MLVPNLFLIGAQKGGSTSLFTYLIQHPDITPLGKALGKGKEPNVFCADTEEQVYEQLSKASLEQTDCRYYIDASVNYSRYPRFSNTVRNVYKVCDAEKLKFIYIIRNPVDRLISNYFWNTDNFGESRSLEFALQTEEQYIKTSLYDLQIEQYLQYFSIDRFHFVRFEDFVESPCQTANSIFGWLGLDELENLSAKGKRGATNKNVTRAAKFPVVNNLIWSSRPLRTVINQLFTQSTIKRMSKFLTKEQVRPEVSTAFKRHLLEEHFLESIQRTSKMTGLNLSQWLDSFR